MNLFIPGEPTGPGLVAGSPSIPTVLASATPPTEGGVPSVFGMFPYTSNAYSVSG